MITVFTPTYNRADKLERLFSSLMKQSDPDFEWLVIDDGSADHTEQLITRLSKGAHFPVRYYRQENGGKHRAYNRALELAAGEWFFCVDSDDRLAGNALKTLRAYLENCDAQIVAAYKSDANGTMLSGAFPSGVRRGSLYDLEHRCRCTGEFTLVFQTAYASRFPFPTFEGERFMTESVVYDRMAKDETAGFLPAVITVCEYQADGLTGNIQKSMKENPAGFCLYFMQRIDLQETGLKRWITAGKYHAFRFFAGAQKSVYKGTHTVPVLLAKPLGVVFRFYYRFFRGF